MYKRMYKVKKWCRKWRRNKINREKYIKEKNRMRELYEKKLYEEEEGGRKREIKKIKEKRNISVEIYQ